ncbi:carbon-nitrogen hydrolase family protein [Roseovarius faecimaris]|uniref:Carbon-nitrogen hydrolase family protein n=1 Tax=Roseovarius faecimaris TaxID=2494550 RepID=A0A6I6IV53_9RHOB|nr:carbon-nitrogen hydrolase family protein [Roseovarius faecimaris]QGY00113.1 carbon-nitrogen hydrolase family protein [Roseovarius faecimaris]
MRAALLQLNSGDDPAANLPRTEALIDAAVGQGAGFVLTPEVTNCVSSSRARQQDVLQRQEEDITLAALRAKAAAHGIWLLIGSLALKTQDADGRFANRSFLIAPDGAIVAWYDKIHMFDVTVSETESYRESAGYRPGDRMVLADTSFASVGLTICYDLRFPHLFRQLARRGAQVITVPSAFSPVTGAAHWESMLRARAIETGAYILAPAQAGTHQATTGKPRTTYGHSLAVSPWGDVLANGGTGEGVVTIELDLTQVEIARARIPAMTNDTTFDGP